MRLPCEFINRPRVFVTDGVTAETNFLKSHARRTEIVPEFLERFWKRRPRSCCEFILGNKKKSQGIK
jgi:hypothetical protein